MCGYLALLIEFQNTLVNQIPSQEGVQIHKVFFIPFEEFCCGYYVLS